MRGKSHGLFPVRRYVGLRIVPDRVVRHRVFDRFFMLLSGRFGRRQGWLAGGLPRRSWGRLGWRPGRRHGNRPCLIVFQREHLGEVHIFLHKADCVGMALGPSLAYEEWCRPRTGTVRECVIAARTLTPKVRRAPIRLQCGTGRRSSSCLGFQLVQGGEREKRRTRQMPLSCGRIDSIKNGLTEAYVKTYDPRSHP